MSSLDNGIIPQRRKKKKLYKKCEAIKYAKKSSNHKAAKKFHVVVKGIRERRQSKLKIFEPSLKPKNKKLGRGGRKPLDL